MVSVHQNNGRWATPAPAENRAAAALAAAKGKAPALAELAREPDLVGAIRRDLRAVGLVGEEDAGLLVYLAYSSRKLNRALSVIIKGPSGSGKDEVQRRPADLMPPGDIVDAMHLTPQALYYGEPGWLMNKILLGGERRHDDGPEARDKTAAVRQMLGHGYISKETVVDGKTIHIRQDGPVSYSETTTKDSIFREDANRCLQLETNAGTMLTRRVLEASAAEYLPGVNPAAGSDAKAAARRHHEFQRALEYADVRIPYTAALQAAMPAKIEARRAFRQVLSLIEAIAFVHQFHRGRNEHNQMLATVEDYELARRLLLAPLHTAIGLGKDYARCQRFARKLPDGEFDSRQAAAALDANSRKVTQEWLARLAELGVVRCVEPAKGNRPARWCRTAKDVDELLLPSVEAVRACVAALPSVTGG
jgi:hypothetical protein